MLPACLLCTAFNLPTPQFATAFTLPIAPAQAASSLRSSPTMLLPAVPAAAPFAAAGLGLLTLLGIRRASRERENFFSIKWNDDSGVEAGGYACVLIGEEKAADGKQWFLCTDDAYIEGADCTAVGGLGADEDKLCKVPKTPLSA